MNVLYLCDGNKPDCTRESCYVNGGDCKHTSNPACARPCHDGPRLFEEMFPGELYEVDQDASYDTLADESAGGG